MRRRPDDSIRAVVAAVEDLVPRALWAVDADPDRSLVDLVVPAHMRGPRWVCPAPGALDHWETVQAGEPWWYLEIRADGTWVGLQAEGPKAVARAAALLDDADRLERVVAAAARLGPSSSTGAVAVRHPPHGRFEERPVLDRIVDTDQVGRAVLEGVFDVASSGRGVTAGETVAVRFVRAPIDAADLVASRRTVRRVVRMWQAAWRVPRPRVAPLLKEDLDRALRAVYRGSLRNLLHGDPRIRARLRVEARELARAYRDSGRARPRLLDLILDRLRIVE